MYNNLTKENFFNDMKEKYPQAMEKFCAFIDEYKKNNNWAVLFNEEHKAPKYHELPVALQMGIFTEWIWSLEANRDYAEEIKELMEDAFDDIERPEIEEEDENDGDDEGVRNHLGEEV